MGLIKRRIDFFFSRLAILQQFAVEKDIVCNADSINISLPNGTCWLIKAGKVEKLQT